MPKSANERGIKSPFKLRVGIDVDTFRGLNLENDPGAIADSEFQDLINARIRSGGEIVSRGGQDKMFTDALDSAVVGIFDDEIVEPPAMLYIGAVDVRTWTTAQTPNIQAVGTVDKTVFMVGVFLNAVWFYAANGANWDFYSIAATPGGGIPAPVFRFSAAGWDGSTAALFGESLSVGGKLYMWTTRTGGIGGTYVDGVYSYDGASLALEFSSILELNVITPGAFSNRGVRLQHIGQTMYAVVVYHSAPDPGAYIDISIRTRNSGTGVWSELTRWTADSAAANPSHAKDAPFYMTAFQGKLYFGCTQAIFAPGPEEMRIRAVDPAAIVGGSADFALVRTVLSSVPGNVCVVNNMVAFNSHLYYVYFDNGDNKVWLGRFDGSTWDDKHADMTATFAPAGFYPRGPAFIASTSTLYMLCSGTLFQSNGTDTTSWTTIATGLPQALENFSLDGVRL